MNELLRDFLSPLSETLASAIVIVSASLLLYNLSRNMRNRVARTSGVMLACVTMVYAMEVLLFLGPGPGSAENLLRAQWIGVAFIPAAIFHLSDALLATTGLPSRGRRRRVVRLLYAIATAFMLLAAFTDVLISPEFVAGRVSMRAALALPIFLVYFILVNMVAFLNVNRARRRCRTRGTERRMAYLQAVMLAPSISIFPYSVLLPAGEEFSLGALLIVNLANLLVVLTLLFLAYPLSFFGSRIPDRVVKSDLLKFMLLGPGTGMLALAVMIFSTSASDVLGLPGQAFMPFGVVAVILLWQWSVDIALPWLERLLIYNQEDDEQLARIQTLSERLLTRTDLLQLIEATLESACDYLRVSSAFVAEITERGPSVIRAVGPVSPSEDRLQNGTLVLTDELSDDFDMQIHEWGQFWVLPLRSRRTMDVSGSPTLIGFFAVEARGDEIALYDDEVDMLARFSLRLARTLDDLRLQTEIYAALAGLLPQIAVTRSVAADVEFAPGRDGIAQFTTVLDREQVVEQVRAALRHYWGGPGLSSSRLLELITVRNRLDEHEQNPARALRSVLQEAIERQRPPGERDMRSPEWTIYNILDLRFIESKKVKETARRLYVSEANLYRKQNVAIELVADTIIQMEQEALADQKRLVQ